MDSVVRTLLPQLKTCMKWNWDCSLPVVAGILSVLCAIKVGGEKNDVYYRSLMIGLEGHDVIRLCGWVIVFLALALLYTGSQIMTSQSKTTSSNCLRVMLFLLASHFLSALILTEYKNMTLSSLKSTLLGQLETSRMAHARFGVSFHLNELWDLLQVNMQCCGVESYKDYGKDPDYLPQSCCVLKQNSVIPQPENLAQCKHDVRLGVRGSAFLYTRGCGERLVTWFMRYTASISGLLFGSISLQVINILYLLWRNMAPGNRPTRDSLY